METENVIAGGNGILTLCQNQDVKKDQLGYAVIKM